MSKTRVNYAIDQSVDSPTKQVLKYVIDQHDVCNVFDFHEDGEVLVYIAQLSDYILSQDGEIHDYVQNLVNQVAFTFRAMKAIPEPLALVMICKNVSFGTEFTKLFRICAHNNKILSKHLRRFVFYYIPQEHIRRSIPDIFSEYFSRKSNNKKEDTMAIKRAKKFVVVGSDFSKITRKLVTANIQQTTQYQLADEIDPDTAFVICFTDSVTRNPGDHYPMLNQLMNQIAVHRRDMSKCPVLFLNLTRFPSEESELDSFNAHRESGKKVSDLNDSYSVLLDEFTTPNTKWVCIPERHRTDGAYLSGILIDFLEKVEQTEIPTPQKTSTDDLDKVLTEMRIADMLGSLQQQMLSAKHQYLSIQEFTEFREKITAAVIELKSAVSSLERKYDRIVFNPNPVSEKLRELNEFKEDTTSKLVSLEDTISRLVDAKVKEVLSKMESFLGKKIVSGQDTIPESQLRFEQYLESTDKDTTPEIDPSFEQYIEGAVETKIQTEDDQFFHNLYRRNILHTLYSLYKEDCITVDSFDPEWVIDDKIKEFTKVLSMNIADFYTTYPEDFRTKDGKTYALSRAKSVFRNYQFLRISDWIALPNDARLAARLFSKLDRIIAATLNRLFGIRITWMK